MVRGRMSVLVAALALVTALAARGHAQADTVETVVARAAAYVAGFERQLSSVVAEEHYVQDWTALPRGSRLLSGRRHRELASDLLLVKPSGGDGWMQFRDVFEVDRTPVRDRNERLVTLFLQPAHSVETQIARILDESARYNIGNIQRTVNTPVFPLAFLEPVNQPRFRFFRTKDQIPLTARTDAPGTSASVPAFRVSTDVWVVRYEEVRRNTMIRTTNLRDLPSHGRFWIEPDTGRVLMSEIVAEDRAVRATIDVSYQSEPLLGLLLPIEMRERYEDRRNGSLVVGRATYGKFRQFQVTVEEKLAPIIKK
jgi:hypothetical protein